MNIQTTRQFESGRNPAEAWEFRKQDFADFLEPSGYATQSETTETAVFRHIDGSLNQLLVTYATHSLIAHARMFWSVDRAVKTLQFTSDKLEEKVVSAKGSADVDDDS
ncbi:hypothetical protein AVEN_99024-1 [Araneus ventricosus]|uniref:Uncharacterized protein n=1 Tax=Araneus ventricosus TaxID=182803 RepID=A0A4Y2G5D2_ARAVE|nr:hypothetical protein AVEN_99024-1 [Araneus ventricosus]